MLSHTQKVTSQVRRLDNLLLNMEMGEKGPLPTGKNSFLESYRSAIDQWDTQVANLKKLVKTDPIQIERVNKINSGMEQWITLTAMPKIAQQGKVQESTNQIKGTVNSIKTDIKKFIGIQENLISFRKQAIQISSDRTIHQFIWGILATILIAFVAGYYLLRSILKPLKELSEAVQKITEGDLSVSATVHSSDQIGDLAISFNTMTEQLSNAIKQTDTSRIKLESQTEILEVARLEAETNAFNLQNALNALSDQKYAMDEHSIIATTDLSGSITYVNQKFCDLSGYTKEELVGANHRLLNSGNKPESYWRNMFLTVTDGNTWNDEVLNKAKDGQFYWVDTTIVPILRHTTELHKDGSTEQNKIQVEGYIAIRTNITEQKEQEQNLINAKIAAESATVAKTQFLATMSHEIRTPMNGVIGMAQLLEDTQLSNEQKDYVATISSSGDGLLSIINDILDYSKLDAEMVEIERIAFNLERTCQESIELTVVNALKKDLEIIMDYQPDCPRYLIGDPSRLRQILINLLSNAIKFTAKGYVRLGISWQINASGKHYLHLEVQDTGIGLKPEAIEHLFHEFTQADTSTTRNYGGTGLGLAITKRLAMLMGGDIGVSSNYGSGSTFWVDLALPKGESPPPLKFSPLKDVRILFVDDNVIYRRIFKDLLNHMEARASIETNINGTINTLQNAIQEKDPFKIVILDHNLLETSGLDIGMKIRSDNLFIDLKMLIFSSAGQQGDTALFAKSGFDAYLNKIASYEVLQSMLSAMLEHSLGDPIITRHSIKSSNDKQTEFDAHFEASVLLVDDVALNQLIAKKFLTKMGIEVSLANNGKEALSKVEQNKFDLVFMDCQMPIMDGYEATYAIRVLEKEGGKIPTPIIALTANASSEDKILCEQAGMDDVLTKPFMRSDLITCLEHWLPTL
ncbi:MAG: response regulator [Pseudomonadales bacterium]|nr:response regulator [Pseudomonadales bacterium]